MILFKNRLDAGKALANKMQLYKGEPETIVLAIRKAGLPVAYEVANKLQSQLEIFLLSKIKAVQKKSIAIGTVASGGIEVLNNGVIQSLNISKEQLAVNILVEKRRLMRRQHGLRGDRPYPNFSDRTIFLVDDGGASPAKIRAAIAVLRKANTKRVIFAVPIISQTIKSEIEVEADQLVTLAISDSFLKVQETYENYLPVDDYKVKMFLS